MGKGGKSKKKKSKKKSAKKKSKKYRAHKSRTMAARWSRRRLMATWRQQRQRRGSLGSKPHVPMQDVSADARVSVSMRKAVHGGRSATGNRSNNFLVHLIFGSK